MAWSAPSAKRSPKWERFSTPPITRRVAIRITHRHRSNYRFRFVAMKPRLLMLVPTATYRAEAFVRAAQRLPIQLSLASEVPSSLSHLHPVDLPAFDFGRPYDVMAAARSLAEKTRIDGVVAVDDQ